MVGRFYGFSLYTELGTVALVDEQFKNTKVYSIGTLKISYYFLKPHQTYFNVF
jgi:hypothetical protein